MSKRAKKRLFDENGAAQSPNNRRRVGTANQAEPVPAPIFNFPFASPVHRSLSFESVRFLIFERYFASEISVGLGKQFQWPQACESVLRSRGPHPDIFSEFPDFRVEHDIFYLFPAYSHHIFLNFEVVEKPPQLTSGFLPPFLSRL